MSDEQELQQCACVFDEHMHEVVVCVYHADIAARLAQVADLAHSGGLANLSEADALVAIRRLTLPQWDRSGSEQELRGRVTAALTAAAAAP